MNFKSPRDPNTKSNEYKIRDIGPDENLRCQVGSGECPEPAIEAYDNGECGEFRLCAKHLPEFHALSKLIAEMTPNQISDFDAAITKASHHER